MAKKDNPLDEFMSVRRGVSYDTRGREVDPATIAALNAAEHREKWEPYPADKLPASTSFAEAVDHEKNDQAELREAARNREIEHETAARREAWLKLKTKVESLPREYFEALPLLQDLWEGPNVMHGVPDPGDPANPTANRAACALDEDTRTLVDRFWGCTLRDALDAAGFGEPDKAAQDFERHGAALRTLWNDRTGDEQLWPTLTARRDAEDTIRDFVAARENLKTDPVGDILRGLLVEPPEGKEMREQARARGREHEKASKATPSPLDTFMDRRKPVERSEPDTRQHEMLPKQNHKGPSM